MRRAERLVVALAAEEEVNGAVIRYLNRLSDHLFVLSRRFNAAAGGDVLGHAYYYDEGLAAFTSGPGRKTAEFLDEVVDQKVIDGAVNGVAKLIRKGGLGLRRIQDGSVRRYALGILIGAVAILLFLLAYVAR